jgi:hypothetical protein
MGVPGGQAVTCESCGHIADVRLPDGSVWCLGCNESANNLGYDNYRGRWLPGRKRAGER